MDTQLEIFNDQFWENTPKHRENLKLSALITPSAFLLDIASKTKETFNLN